MERAGTDETFVRDLVRDLHPDLADLEIRPVPSGWDNQLWRLGDELAVRLPMTERAPALLRKEFRWLPELAKRLRCRYRHPSASASRHHAFPGRGSSRRGFPANRRTALRSATFDKQGPTGVEPGCRPGAAPAAASLSMSSPSRKAWRLRQLVGRRERMGWMRRMGPGAVHRARAANRDQSARVNVWAVELVQRCWDRRAPLAAEPLSTVRHLPLWRAVKRYCPLVPTEAGRHCWLVPPS